MKKETIAARVAAGTMTQEQADAIISRIEENQLNCDGSGTCFGRNGKGLGEGAGFGQNAGQGRGKNRQGLGKGMRNGSCGRR